MCCCFVDRPLGVLLILSILCLHLSQSDGGSGSVIICGTAATLSSELKPKMNVFMIWICDRVFDSFGIGDKCARQVEEQKFQQEEERCGERGEKEESIPTWPRPSRHYLWRVRGNCNLSPPSIDDVVPDQS